MLVLSEATRVKHRTFRPEKFFEVVGPDQLQQFLERFNVPRDSAIRLTLDEPPSSRSLMSPTSYPGWRSSKKKPNVSTTYQKQACASWWTSTRELGLPTTTKPRRSVWLSACISTSRRSLSGLGIAMPSSAH